MARITTSRRRGLSWLGKPRKLRPGAKVTDFDPTEGLRDPALIKKAVLQALEAGDDEGAVDIMRAHLRVLNRSRTASRMKMSRVNVHRIISGSRRPSLDTLGAFIRMLNAEAGKGAGATA